MIAKDVASLETLPSQRSELIHSHLQVIQSHKNGRISATNDLTFSSASLVEYENTSETVPIHCHNSSYKRRFLHFLHPLWLHSGASSLCQDRNYLIPSFDKLARVDQVLSDRVRRQCSDDNSRIYKFLLYRNPFASQLDRLGILFA